jgi:hypothetical protein
MVTTATGKGVSVLDFLCATQSEDMMTSVLEFFKFHNPAARDKIKSVVIDKDYKEWRALEAAFPHTTVVLCIFHVLKWFKYVLHRSGSGNYGFEDDTKKAVLRCLRKMVFAPDTDALAAQQLLLPQLLSPATLPGHAEFLRYMETYWYNCVEMWSYAGRGLVFTATNSTSNRLESYWNQYKTTLGKKQRIDLCVEAIFTHATSVLRREEGIFNDYASAKPVHEFADAYLVPVLMELSKYSASLVKQQWTRYVVTRAKMKERVASRRGNVRYIIVAASRDVEYQIDTARRTCSCRFYQGSGLPCRHLFYTAQVLLREVSYPLTSISPRWRMEDAQSIVPSLHQAVLQMETLRSSLLRGPAGPEAKADPRGDDAIFVLPTLKAVERKKLSRGQYTVNPVRADLDKRAIVDTVLEPLRKALMADGSATFASRVPDVEDAVRLLLSKWRGGAATHEAVSEANRVENADTTQTTHIQAPGFYAPDTSSDEWQLFLSMNDDDYEFYFEEDGDDIAQEDARATTSEPFFDGLDIDVYDDGDVSSLFASQGSLIYASHLSQPASTGEVRFQPARLASSSMNLDRRSSAFGLPVSPVRMTQVIQGAIVARRNGARQQLDELLAAADADATHEHVTTRELSTANVDSAVAASPKQVKRKRSGEATLEDTPSRNTRSKKTASTAPADVPVISQMTLPYQRKGVTKQSKQMTSATGKEAYVVQTDDCPIRLADFLSVLHHGSMTDAVRLHEQYPRLFTDRFLAQKHASARFEEYLPKKQYEVNFVIPSNLIDSLATAVIQQRAADGNRTSPSNLLSPIADALPPQYVARVSTLRGFTESAIVALQEFHSTGGALEQYAQDAAWPLGDWTPPRECEPLTMLQEDANEVEGVLNTLNTTRMREAVRSAFLTLSLNSRLQVPGDTTERSAISRFSITVREILGHLAFKQRLNDSTLNYALSMLATRFRGVVTVDSLNVGVVIPPPAADFASTNAVLFPLLYQAGHWCIVMCKFAEGVPSMTAVYDPLGGKACHAFMEETWESWCWPYITAWNERSEEAKQCTLQSTAETAALVPPRIVIVRNPYQTDSSSCGVYCILQAHAFMADSYSLQDVPSFASPYPVKLARLRLMWLLICQSSVVSDAAISEETRTTATVFATYVAEKNFAVVARPKPAAREGAAKRKAPKSQKRVSSSQ